MNMDAFGGLSLIFGPKSFLEYSAVASINLSLYMDYQAGVHGLY